MSNIELSKQGLIEAIARLDDEQVQQYTTALIREGCASRDIQACLNQGLKQVKELFEKGEYFIADLIYSGTLCHLALSLLTDSLQKPECHKKARILIGVAENDIHNIGKDIVAGLLSADGYDVVDLGSNVTPLAFVNAIRTYSPQLVLMSGMMHFARESMMQTIEAISAAGLRDQVYILLGGGCVTSSTPEQMQADAIAIEPIDTLNLCNEFINRRCQ